MWGMLLARNLQQRIRRDRAMLFVKISLAMSAIWLSVLFVRTLARTRGQKTFEITKEQYSAGAIAEILLTVAALVNVMV